MSHIRRAYSSEAKVLSDLAFRSKAHWDYTSEFMDACKDELSYTPEQIDDNKYIYTVTVKDEGVVGFYKLENIQQERILLEALFVDPSFIGLGIGKVLFEHAKQSAIEHRGLFLDVQSDPNAEEFYTNMGMTIIGKQESGSIQGRYLPTLTMPLTNDV